jgi:hypothetical protein
MLAFPFAYFYHSRLRHGRIAYHAIYEWSSALLIAALFGDGNWAVDLVRTVLCYGAFISLYEIGYLANDYYSVKWDSNPRSRGPQVAKSTLATWVSTRLLAFACVTKALGFASDPAWYVFFVSLALTFAAHDLTRKVEVKCLTFLWLATYRFTAPTFFVVAGEERQSLLAAGFVLYAVFRLFGYLESKDVLQLPQRKSPWHRIAFYLLPVPLSALLWLDGHSLMFPVLNIYFLATTCAGLVWDWSRAEKGRQ